MFRESESWDKLPPRFLLSQQVSIHTGPIETAAHGLQNQNWSWKLNSHKTICPVLPKAKPLKFSNKIITVLHRIKKKPSVYHSTFKISRTWSKLVSIQKPERKKKKANRFTQLTGCQSIYVDDNDKINNGSNYCKNTPPGKGKKSAKLIEWYSQ